MAAVVIALDGRLFDGAVHPLDLAVRPRVVDLGEPVLDAVFVAAQVEHVGDEPCVGPSAWRGGRRNWMPLSVGTVWIL